MTSYVTVLCMTMFAQHGVPEPSKMQLKTCEQVATQTIQQGHDPIHLITVGWYESAHIPTVVSSKGAVGPLQVLKRYWCPKKGRCDYISAGIKAWDTYLEQSKGNIENTLCRYNSGQPCKKASKNTRYYMSRITKAIQKLRKSIEKKMSWHERWVNEQCIRCPHCCTSYGTSVDDGDPEFGDQEFDNALEACTERHRYDGTKEEVQANCLSFLEDGDVCLEDNHYKLQEGWTREQLEKWCKW